MRSIEYSETKSNIDRPRTSATVLSRTMTDKSKILCDLVPKTNTEEVPNEQVLTRYLAAVPIVKVFTMGDCMARNAVAKTRVLSMLTMGRCVVVPGLIGR